MSKILRPVKAYVSKVYSQCKLSDSIGLNSTITFAVLMIIVLFILLALPRDSVLQLQFRRTSTVTDNLEKQRPAPVKMDWTTVNLTEHSIPNYVKSLVKTIKVNESRINVQGVSVLFREAVIPEPLRPSGQSLLLLHGAAFTSKTWVDTIDTLQHLASMSHRAVAIDLPGFGSTSRANVGDRAEFLAELIGKLELERPVLISPSMSGGWSLPFLVSHPDMISGYVPVAPVGTESIKESTYKTIQVPTLIVYGQQDHALGLPSKRNLQALPNRSIYELPNARHPAYLDQTDLWHKLLYNFMLKLNSGASNE